MKITQANDTKTTFVDVVIEEGLQETLVLLKILELGEREYKAGQFKPIDEVVARIKSQALKPAT